MGNFLETIKLYQYFLAHPNVCTDSRKVQQGDLFFALVGPTFDGNDYALKALDQGAAFAVVSRADVAEHDERCLLVEDTLVALQLLANHHRRKLGTMLIAITGTNGKTTTKELTLAALRGTFRTLATEGNLNNHIGVPLTLLRLRSEHDIGVIEMGASAKGEIDLLCKIAEPDIGLVTNIGKAHLEGFGSQWGILEAKSELPQFLEKHGGKFLLNMDDPLLAKLWGSRAFSTYGGRQQADIQGKVTGEQPLRVELVYGAQWATVESTLVGRYNATNILAATALALTAGAPLSRIAEGISAYQPSNNRSQLIKLQGDRMVIMDAYNANPSSMMAALESLIHQPQERKVALLGDMLELGEASQAEHLQVVEWLKAHPEINGCLVGQEFGRVCGDAFVHSEDINGLMAIIAQNPLPEQSVTLIKGSRGMALERLLPVIEKGAK